MSLFSKLFQLSASDREDFHTEIVGNLLRYSRDAAIQWLRAARITELLDAEEIAITTQEEYAALDDHGGIGSRPDLTIRLANESRKELIFIESKLGATEGWKQLTRYSDHLRATNGYDKRTLVYITRDYDPKPDNLGRGVDFIPLRWCHFYNFFNGRQSKDPLTLEMLQFMRENNMHQSNQFNAIDIIALTNFPKARKLMDQTMWETVAVKFKAVCGKTSDPCDAILQLRKFNRYVMYSIHGEGHLHIILGYFMDDEAVTNSPSVGIRIFIAPKSEQRSDVATLMRDYLSSKSGMWTGHELSNSQAWGWIASERQLQTFLATGEDHVKAIASYLEERLDDVGEFLLRNKSLSSRQIP